MLGKAIVHQPRAHLRALVQSIRRHVGCQRVEGGWYRLKGIYSDILVVSTAHHRCAVGREEPDVGTHVKHHDGVRARRVR